MGLSKIILLVFLYFILWLQDYPLTHPLVATLRIPPTYCGTVLFIPPSLVPTLRKKAPWNTQRIIHHLAPTLHNRWGPGTMQLDLQRQHNLQIKMQCRSICWVSTTCRSKCRSICWVSTTCRSKCRSICWVSTTCRSICRSADRTIANLSKCRSICQLADRIADHFYFAYHILFLTLIPLHTCIHMHGY